MSSHDPDSLLARRLAREQAARRAAEKLLEQKSLELYEALQTLSIHLGQRTTQLEESEIRSRKLIELVPEAIWVETAGRMVFVNDAAARLFGASAAADLLESVVLERVPEQYRERMQDPTRRIVEDQQAPAPLTIQLMRLDGGLVDVELVATAIQFQNAASVLVVARDISDRKRHEAALEYQATHDLLTGLPNKTLFLDRLGQAISSAERYPARIGVLFVDLDQFKYINDTLGHSAGDELLQTAARRLKYCIRDCDTVARLGGDEFVLLIDRDPDVATLSKLVQRLVPALAVPVTLMGQQHSLTCSIGISMYPEDGKDPESLLKRADIAMYRAKEAGRNTYQFFTSRMQERLDEHLRLEQQLRRALARDEFVLHFQPQVDLRTGNVVGLEALIRWQAPELGLLPPARFISIAEQSNLILAIGEWVIHAACGQAQAWLARGLPLVRVAVNVAAAQITHQRIEDVVLAALRASNLEGRFLGLELTESMSMEAPETSIEWMRRLRELGVSFSIDDFGTGYSNLGYLKRFPVDKLKIDRSFIQGITTDPQSRSITTAITKLAHSLGLRAVAEGVETEGQLRLLMEEGCDEMQGYYFCRPLPEPEIAALLQSQPRLNLEQARRLSYNRTLLLVDDDRDIFTLFERLLRDEQVQLITAESPADAYQVMAGQEVGVVICDQHFPAGDGVDFLEKIKLLYPRTVRILLTMDDSPSTLSGAINRGEVYRFLSKFGLDSRVREALREAFQRYES